MPAINWTYNDNKAQQLAQQQQMSPRQQAYYQKVAQLSGGKSLQEQALANMSGADRFWAGMGGGMESLVQGIKQRARLESQSDINDFRDDYDPLNKTREGSIGSMAGQTALTLPTMFIPGANTAVGSVIMGGGMGALQPTREGESWSDNAQDGMIGGAAGHFIGQGAGAAAKYGGNKIGQWIRGAAAQDAGQEVGQQAAQQTAQQSSQQAMQQASQGATQQATGAAANASANAAPAAFSKTVMRSTPAQASGSRVLAIAEDKLPALTNPARTANNKALEKVVNDAIGAGSDKFDSGTILNTFGKAQDAYDSVPNAGTQALDSDAIQANLDSIESKYGHLFDQNNPSLSSNKAVRNLQQLAAAGNADTAQLADIGKSLTGAIGQNSRTAASRPYALALGEVKQAVDDLIQPQLSGDAADAFGVARTRADNLIKLADPDVFNHATQSIDTNFLDAALADIDPAGYTGGGNQSDFYNAIRFAKDKANQAVIGNPASKAPDSILANTLASAYGSKPSVYLAQALGDLDRAPGSAAGAMIGTPSLASVALQNSAPTDAPDGQATQAASDDMDAIP